MSSSRPSSWRTALALLAVPALAALTGCGLGDRAPASGRLEVVAAENFWGSIAAQVGGGRVHVTSILSNPNTDPHDYDANPGDARLIARAAYVIANGAGYDPWVARLLAANPVPGRASLDIGGLVGVREGGNPHLWYSPDYVARVVDRLAADFARLDPAGSSSFEQLRRRYLDTALGPYRAAVAAIRERHPGAAAGCSESIFAYMAQATGLNLVTPPAYMKAISDGVDPSAADKATVNRQLETRQVQVFVYNAQNSTPDVQGTVGRARAAGIPVVEITETPVPPGLAFQDWQTRQLTALLQALGG